MTFLQPNDVTVDLLQNFLTDGATAFLAEDDALGLALLRAGQALQKAPPPTIFQWPCWGNPLTSSDADIPDWTTFLVPRREMGSRPSGF